MTQIGQAARFSAICMFVVAFSLMSAFTYFRMMVWSPKPLEAVWVAETIGWSVAAALLSLLATYAIARFRRGSVHTLAAFAVGAIAGGVILSIIMGAWAALDIYSWCRASCTDITLAKWLEFSGETIWVSFNFGTALVPLAGGLIAVRVERLLRHDATTT